VTIARELITLLRYEIDDSNLKKFQKQRPSTTFKPGVSIPGIVPGPIPNNRPAPNVPGMPTPAVIDKTDSAMRRLTSVMRTFLAGLGVAALAKISDEWAGVEGRVGLVTNGIDEQRYALKQLFDVAQATGQQYESVAGLFTAVQRNAKELGLGLDDTLALSRTIGTALTIGGGSAESQKAALTQLQQALGSGKLSGEELNSVLEQAPRLAQAIADAFKVPVGGLKKLAEAGKLTSKEVATGLLKQSEKLAAEFERMPKTFSRSWTMIKNKFGQLVDRINKGTRASERFFEATSWVLKNFEQIVKTVAFIGAAALLTKMSYMARALAASGGFFARAMRAFGGAKAFGVLVGAFARMLAVATAIYYVFDDIGVWLAGGESLLGDVIGPLKEWKWLIDGVGDALLWIRGLFGQITEGNKQFLAKWSLLAVIVAGVVLAIGWIPAAILALIVAFAAVINYVRNNWNTLIDGMTAKLRAFADTVLGMFPEWFRAMFTGAPRISVTDGSTMAGTASRPIIGPGGAAFGITPAMMNRRNTGAGAPTTIVQSPQVTVNATSSQPAAVAEATVRGVQRGMGAAAVPMVEAGP
jgi:tape measure domain-containing protein